MNLRTKYMGLDMASPLIVSSSKLTSTIENLRKCEEAGAGAVVLKSLFEEQILAEIESKLIDDSMYFYFPEAREHVSNISKDHGVREYMKLIEAASAELSIPVIASVNCVSANEWPAFAKRFEEAGAAGLELNISIYPFDPEPESLEIEDQYIAILSEVRKHVSIPVSVKLGYNFSNLSRLVVRLEEAGANAVVLFNRYLRPDIDIDTMEIIDANHFSAPEEMSESLRWIGILSGQVSTELAASTGVHSHEAAIKQLLAGAYAVQVCSVLYKEGMGKLPEMLRGIEDWMTAKKFSSIAEFRGKLSQDELQGAAYERLQFMKRTNF